MCDLMNEIGPGRCAGSCFAQIPAPRKRVLAILNRPRDPSRTSDERRLLGEVGVFSLPCLLAVIGLYWGQENDECCRGNNWSNGNSTGIQPFHYKENANRYQRLFQ